MRCFYVLVHGGLTWRTGTPPTNDGSGIGRLQGFCCHRYVLAASDDQAKRIAFARVRANLEKQTGWMSAGLATLDLEAEEVSSAPIHKLLMPDNRGHTFY